MKPLDKYPMAMRLTHWLSTLIIFGMLPLGWYMTSLDDSSPSQFTLFNFHQSVGVCLLILALARIFIKLRSRHPGISSDLPAWEKTLAKSVHTLLYAILVIMPLTGIFMTLFSGYKVPFFFFEFPNGLTENKPLGKTFESIHSYLAYGLAGLIVLHVGGILKELVISKKNLLKKMI